MAVLFVAEESRSAGEAHACQYVSLFCSLRSVGVEVVGSVRFAPPLVISEEDLKRAVKIIGECLADLDNVFQIYALFLLAFAYAPLPL